LLAFEFHRSGIAIRGSLYSNIEWEAVIEHLFLDDTLITDAPEHWDIGIGVTITLEHRHWSYPWRANTELGEVVTEVASHVGTKGISYIQIMGELQRREGANS